MSVTHIAGPVIVLGGRLIQRCVVCGEKLADSKNTAMAALEDGTVPSFPTWRQAAFVQFDENRQSETGVFTHAPIPDDFCLALVES